MNHIYKKVMVLFFLINLVLSTLPNSFALSKEEVLAAEEEVINALEINEYQSWSLDKGTNLYDGLQVPNDIDPVSPSLGYFEQNFYTEKDLPSLSHKVDYIGIGIVFCIDDEGYVVIEDIYKGSPAEKAGLVIEDRIAGIEGAPIDMTVQEQLDTFKQSAEINGTIEVIRDGVHLKMPISSARIVIPGVEGRMLSEDIGYIQIHNMKYGSADQFKKTYSILMVQGMKKLVLDLRGEGEGFVNEMSEIAEVLLPKDADIYEWCSYDDSLKTVKVKSGATEMLPLITITNASESEKLALVYALRHNHRGLFIDGSTYSTYDKGMALIKTPDGRYILDDSLWYKIYDNEDSWPENVVIDYDTVIQPISIFQSRTYDDCITVESRDSIVGLMYYLGMADPNQKHTQEELLSILGQNGYLENGVLSNKKIEELKAAALEKYRSPRQYEDELLNEAVNMIQTMQ